MKFTDWNTSCIWGGITLIALLFAIFQYFNKKGLSKKRVLAKSIISGLLILIPVYFLGQRFLIESPKSPMVIHKPVFRSTPVENLSEENVRDMIYKYNFYSMGHNPTIWRNPTGQEFKNKFVIHHEGQAAIDLASGLMWQTRGSIFATKSFMEAEEYIKQLNANRFLGYKDWRLPTLEEAVSLVKRVKAGPILHIDPIFDVSVLAIWTCDKLNRDRAWLVLFNVAGANHYELDSFMGWARAVRGISG